MQYKSFEKKHRIRFSECDPAGIVFYPEYFIMLNDLIEEWVDAIFPCTYSQVIAEKKIGLPTVHLDINFRAISKMGDDVILSINLLKIGSRSLHFQFKCVGEDGVLRMEIDQVIVTTCLNTHKAIEVPDFFKEAFSDKKALIS